MSSVETEFGLIAETVSGMKADLDFECSMAANLLSVFPDC